MTYDFNRVFDRENSGSVKWDLREMHDEKDLIPMWIADMDFKSPEGIINALCERSEHGIFGYTHAGNSYKDAVTGWMKKRHSWRVDGEWLTTTPGLIPALSMAITAFSEPGDRIVIQPPVYHPFGKVISINNRVPADNRLFHDKGVYTMDLAGLETVFREGASMIVLCSPHNPVGRVWKKDELKQLAELCLKYNVLIISDEIHSDLLMPGYKHTVMAGLSDEIADNTITFTAASKTFNLAGLACSNVIISNPGLRKTFRQVIKTLAIGTPNIFGLIAAEAGYRTGGKWLEELCLYIKANNEFLEHFIKENLPEIKTAPLEGTYLAWLDFNEFSLPDEELTDILIKEAKVWLDNGPQFGKGGEGFQRLNLACPRSILEKALSGIEKAFKKRN
jgi:cystathionine beta-lyase